MPCLYIQLWSSYFCFKTSFFRAWIIIIIKLTLLVTVFKWLALTTTVFRRPWYFADGTRHLFIFFSKKITDIKISQFLMYFGLAFVTTPLLYMTVVVLYWAWRQRELVSGIIRRVFAWIHQTYSMDYSIDIPMILPYFGIKTRLVQISNNCT